MRVAGVVTLDGSPESARRARGLAEALSLASLRDDVALVISELTSNASLHGRPPVSIRVLEREESVRVEVTDTGNSLPVRPRPSEEAMTGRGLRLVGALSQHWGVEPLPAGGKVVWAELCPGADQEPYAVADDALDELLAELASADEAARSEQLHTVHLGAVPTEFLLAAKSHIDDVIRELELVSSQAGTTGEPLPAPVRLLIEAVTRDFAPARAAIKRQALESAARGELVTQLTLRLPLSAADAGERYLAALDEIDRQSRSARMLTLAPPRSHVAFRRWYLRGLIDQLRAAARGESLHPPEPFPQVLAAQVDDLAALLETQTRLRVLQSIGRRLTETRSVDEMAATVADLASTYDGVRSVRILLRTDRGTLKSVAWHGGPAGGEADEIPLDAEFPVAEAARSGERLHARTLTDVYRRFPALEAAGLYSEDRSFHAVPLTIASNVIGVLTVTFRVGDVTDEAQQEFVTAIADVLAQAIERSLATERARAAVTGDAHQDEGAARLAHELAVNAGGVGAFDWDLVTGELVWDEQLLEIFGFGRDHSRVLTIETFYNRVHPDDQERVQGLLDTAIAEVGDYDAEYRILMPDGGTRWVTARGRAIAGAEGRAIRLLGAAQDTTARRHAELRVARVLDAMSTAFIFLDSQWRFLFVNGEAERVLGRSRSDLLGQTIWETFPAAVGSDFDIQYRHAASTGQPVAFDAYYPEPLNAWYEVRAWPSPDGLAIYFLDVTERRAAHEAAQDAVSRARLLSRISEELAGTLDTHPAMRSLAQILTPTLADWCVVTVIDDDRQAGTRRGLGAAVGWHKDAQLRDLVDRYARMRLEQMTDHGLIVRAVETAEPQVLNGDAMQMVRGMFPADSEPLRVLEELDTYAVAVLPLIGQEHPVGMLSVVNSRARGPFSEGDLDLLRDAAARAGLVLDRARLYRQQRDVAETLQRSLLHPPPDNERVTIAVAYVPAAEVAQVGGDWYDAFNQPDGAITLIIGDVMGHDLLAAAAMGETRMLMRTLSVQHVGAPARTLEAAEKVMHQLQSDIIATVLVGRLEPIDDGRITFSFSNAGHPPPILLHPDGRVDVLEADPVDPLIGVSQRSRSECTITMTPGQTLVLYTDGLVERRDQAIGDGIHRLTETLAGLTNAAPEQLRDAVLELMLPERREDDVALLVVRAESPR